MEEKLLIYGLSNGMLKHIAEVANGLGCKCTCPNCNEPLVAKNNPSNKKAPHFAHSSGADCVGAYETALHLLAKEVFAEIKQIKTPDFHHDYQPDNSYTLYKKGREVNFTSVTLEKSFGENDSKIIADAVGVILTKDNSERFLIIEFANTHYVDEHKLEKLSTLKLACIEVRLDNQTLDRQKLKEFLLSTSIDIYWICNPLYDEAYRIEFEQKRIKEEQERLDREKRRKENKIRKEEKEHNKEVKNQLKEERQHKTQQEIEMQLKQRYEEYKLQGTYQFYRFRPFLDKFTKKCPMIRAEFAYLQSTAISHHPIIRQILNGEFWNGEIYGYYPNRHMYFKQEKIFIYPKEEMSVQNEKIRNLFYSGLLKIKGILEENGQCTRCKHQVDWLSFDGKNIIVCNYEYSKKTQTSD